MIITKPGKYEIKPQTAFNDKGVPYQVREIEVYSVDPVNHKILCSDLGLIDWDVELSNKTRH